LSPRPIRATFRPLRREDYDRRFIQRLQTVQLRSSQEFRVAAREPIAMASCAAISLRRSEGAHEAKDGDLGNGALKYPVRHPILAIT